MTEPVRWTRAAVYPDMWVDPDEDPRNTDGVSPDGELATLLDYTASYRTMLLMKCEGLDPEQLARRSVPPSTMSLLGLVRHLAEVEREWRGWVSDDDGEPALYGGTTRTSTARSPTRAWWTRRTRTWRASRPRPTRC